MSTAATARECRSPSRTYRDFRPGQDAIAVARLRDVGAIVSRPSLLNLNYNFKHLIVGVSRPPAPTSTPEWRDGVGRENSADNQELPFTWASAQKTEELPDVLDECVWLFHCREVPPVFERGPADDVVPLLGQVPQRDLIVGWEFSYGGRHG
jgi:hypothetical protein